ncbi:hypothetical protein EMCRGX_G014290 [Ephydatia muelleri]
MSTALENEDRDFVTEDDLRAGNELVWVKNNNRLTVRVARAEAEDQKKSFLEDSNSSSDDDGDCVAKNGHSEKDGKGKKKEARYSKVGFFTTGSTLVEANLDDYENMETQLTCGEENECAVLKAQSDSMTAVPSKLCVPEAGKETQESHECNATLSDELRRIRIAVEGNSVPTPNCQLTPSTTLTCDPPSTSKEAQAESQSKPINQSPEYFVNKNGVDLLKVRGTNVVKYALALLDALYTEEELKQSSFVPVGKSTTSVKPPLSPERKKLFEDCLKQKIQCFGTERKC